MKNVFLGAAAFKIDSVVPLVVHDLWIPLDTQGELHILFHYTPLQPQTRKAPVRHRFTQLRVILQSTHFYPGSIVHGAVICGTRQTRKVRGLRLLIDGKSHVQWSTAGKYKTHFYANAFFFNSTTTLFGNPPGEGTTVDSPVGPHIYPFKFALHHSLPPSYVYFKGGNYYSVKAYLDIPAALDKFFLLNFQVLPNPTSLTTIDQFMSISTAAHGTVTADVPVNVTLQGPTTAFVGESYTFKASILNNGTKDIVSVQASLKCAYWFSGYRSGITMVRICGGYKKILAVNINTLPGFPLRPGQSWSGDVTIVIPADSHTSLHSTTSPLVQNDYRISLKVVTSGNVLTKCTGTNKYSIVMTSRNAAFGHIPLPTPHDLTPGVIYTSAFTPEFYQYLVPIYTPPKADESIDCNHLNYGSDHWYVLERWPCMINPALMRDAVQPPQIHMKNVPPGTVPAKDWQPGVKPSFVVEEGISTDDVQQMTGAASSSRPMVN